MRHFLVLIGIFIVLSGRYQTYGLTESEAFTKGIAFWIVGPLLIICGVLYARRKKGP